MKHTELPAIASIFFKLFHYFDLLSKVLSVWLTVKVIVRSLSEPVWASFELIRDVGIVLRFYVLFRILFFVCTLAS